jgi:glutamyl/glutaminyl-tRNA synthetase
LVMRDEDLDGQRSRPEFAKAMLEDLRWLGIRWQEGPDVGGSYAPYVQSRRREFYLDAWRRLVASCAIYPCYCSRRDLMQSAQAPHDDGDEPIYPGTCRPEGTSAKAVAVPLSPEGVNWRFRVPDGAAVSFEDGHFGLQQFVAGRDFGDFLVWRKDDVPSYQLAVVADDAAMQVTEVVRGADLLRSTARQILLYRALGLATPAWYHCPLVMDAAGQRLAKRHDALSLRMLREQGKSAEEVLAMFGEGN